VAAFKSPELKPDQLAALWAKGTFHPVYLWSGPDTLQKDDLLKRLESLFLAGDALGLNVDRFDGDTSDGGDIVTAMKTGAFLGGRRLILVRRAHGLAAKDATLIADEIPNIANGNALVLLWDDKIDQRTVLFQSVRSAGAASVFWQPFEDQLPRWIQERAKVLGKTIAPETAQALLDAAGQNLADLQGELEKLAIYVKDRPRIETSDVEALRPDSHALQYLEFDRAVWRGNSSEVLNLITLRREQGDAPEAVLAHLVRIYRKLFLGKALFAEKRVPEEVWTRLWIKLRQQQAEFKAAVDRLSWDGIQRALENVLQAEWDLKTGKLDPETGLTLLVRKVLGEIEHPKTPPAYPSRGNFGSGQGARREQSGAL